MWINQGVLTHLQGFVSKNRHRIFHRCLIAIRKIYSLHHHRLLAAVAEGEYKSSVVANGYAHFGVHCINEWVLTQKIQVERLGFFHLCRRHNIICVQRTQHHLTVRSTSLPLAAQMNEVALRANDVLRNDVMLRINDVALRANGFCLTSCTPPQSVL